jgi:hypothetical protein
MYYSDWVLTEGVGVPLGCINTIPFFLLCTSSNFLMQNDVSVAGLAPVLRLDRIRLHNEGFCELCSSSNNINLRRWKSGSWDECTFWTQVGDKKSIQNFDRKTSSRLCPYVFLGILVLNMLNHIRRIRRTNPCPAIHTRNLRVFAPYKKVKRWSDCVHTGYQTGSAVSFCTIQKGCMTASIAFASVTHWKRIIPNILSTIKISERKDRYRNPCKR